MRTQTTTHLANIPSGSAGVSITLRTMSELVKRGKKVWPVRELAARLVRGLAQKDYIGEIKRVHAYVRDHIRYLRDIHGVETLHTPEKLIELGQGDCDDKSILLASLLEAIGFTTRFVAVGFKPGTYSHVYVEVQTPAGWVPLETTEPVAAGWSPQGVRARMVVTN